MLYELFRLIAIDLADNSYSPRGISKNMLQLQSSNSSLLVLIKEDNAVELHFGKSQKLENFLKKLRLILLWQLKKDAHSQ